MQGKFITIDGIEGAGKSTQIELMQEFLTQQNQQVIITKEPGGSEFGNKIRQILLDKNTGKLDAKTELLLLFASRREHIIQTIAPALKRGIWVISDRWIDSSYAYQGGGRGVDFAIIKSLEQWSLQDLTADFITPDLSLFLNIDLKLSSQRVDSRGEKDRFEVEGIDFFSKVYNSYQQIIKDNPTRIKEIDANCSIEKTFKQIKAKLNEILD